METAEQILEGKENRVICGSCGYLESGEVVENDVVYFPNRMVYLVGHHTPFECKICGNSTDMVLFGKNYISGIFNPGILKISHVVESNTIWASRCLSTPIKTENSPDIKRKYTASNFRLFG